MDEIERKKKVSKRRNSGELWGDGFKKASEDGFRGVNAKTRDA